MRIKKTYELSEEVVNLIKEISDFFDVPEVEIIELSIHKPKIYYTITKIYEKLKKEKDIDKLKTV